MALTKIIISSLTKAQDAMNFPRKSARYLRERHGIAIPAIEETIYPGDFTGGEFNPEVLCDLTGKHVYLFAVPTDPANILTHVQPGDMKTRAEFAASTAKEWGAEHVTLIAPDLYFSRADKGPEDFESKSDSDKKKLFNGKGNIARAQARAFKANGINRIVTLHSHSLRIQESYREVYGRDDAFIDVSPVPLLVNYLVNHSLLDLKDNGSNVVIIIPDFGGEPIGNEMYGALHRLGYFKLSKIQFSKTRKAANDPNKVEISDPRVSPEYEGIEGKVLLLIDDMDDTSGTRKATCKTIKEDGIQIKDYPVQRPRDIVIYGTHAVHAGLGFESAMKTIAAAGPIEVIYTNSHPSIERNMIFELRKVTSVIRLAPFFGEVIRHLEGGLNIQNTYLTDGTLDLGKIDQFASKPFRRTEHLRYVGERER